MEWNTPPSSKSHRLESVQSPKSDSNTEAYISVTQDIAVRNVETNMKAAGIQPCGQSASFNVTNFVASRYYFWTVTISLITDCRSATFQVLVKAPQNHSTAFQSYQKKNK